MALETIKRCDQVLMMLTAHKYAEPFLEPVDVIGLQLFDYHQKVKEPMDLETVQKKLKNKEYKSTQQFV